MSDEIERWFERWTNIANEAADAGNRASDERAWTIRDVLEDHPRRPVCKVCGCRYQCGPGACCPEHKCAAAFHGAA